ncbi:hypothetical protein FI667_g10112, partial [Globisporangium splendens]
MAYTRFKVADPRTQPASVYADECIPSGVAIYGAGAQVDANGKVTNKGTINGSLIVELSGWNTHTITSLVFSILAAEVYGYHVAFYLIGAVDRATERMSSVRSGVCTPTHVNFEVWTLAARERGLAVYANESYVAGATGYLGYSGIYTTTNFVKDGVNTSLYPSTFYADFWKDYIKNDALIDALSYAKFTSNPAMGGECMVVMMMYDSYDPGYLQAAISNLDIPTYFCFLGYGGLEKYALAAQQQGWSVLFYHYMPDLFLVRHAALFQRVFLPYPSPEQVVQATGTFGENGFGEPTTNPVRVDIPPTKINKYASLRLQESQPIGQFLSKFALSDLIINDLIRLYFDTSTDANEPDPEFRAACNWLKVNYETWRHWLDRLPLCDLSTHTKYTVSGHGDTEEPLTCAQAREWVGGWVFQTRPAELLPGSDHRTLVNYNNLSNVFE